MSIKIEINSITEDINNKLADDLTIELPVTKYDKCPKTIHPYLVTDSSIYVPFGYAIKNNFGIRNSREFFTAINSEFIGILRPEQKEIKKEIIKTLGKTGSILLALYTGFGKTLLSIYLACKLKLKTLIILNRITLMSQWKESINRLCPEATINCITPKTKKNLKDFNIINCINIPKLGRDYFSDIGLVIVDEAHQLLAEKLAESLQYITPRYIIGLSATPYRYDGLNILFNLYFGDKIVYRKLERKHFVYKINTKFTPNMELSINGKVNWNSIIESTSNDIDRNQLIIKIITYFSDRVFLVLCKRLSQANYLLDQLISIGEDVTGLFGDKIEFQQTSRILIGTTGKCSTGFDHPRLNTLLLAVDVEQYFIQVLGRVFRTKEVEPIIFDLVDNNGILEKHFKTRKNVYIEHGGILKNIKIDYPNFII